MSETRKKAHNTADTTDAEPVRTILDNPQVFALFVSMINDQVNEKVRERHESFRNWTLGVLTLVVAAIVTGSIYYIDSEVESTVEMELNSAVENAVVSTVEKAVASAVEKAVDRTELVEQIANLNMRLLGIDLVESFSATDAETIISDIHSLHTKWKDGETRRKLIFAVQLAVKNFAMVDQPDLLVRLESQVPDLVQEGDIYLQMNYQRTYGALLLNDAGAPRSWMDANGYARKTYTRYLKFAEKTRRGGFTESYLAFELLLRYIEGQQETEINNLIEDADRLPEEKADNFVAIMKNLASHSNNGQPTRIVKLAKDFLCAYRQNSELLADVYDELRLQC